MICDQSVTGWLYFAGDLDNAKVIKIGWTGGEDWQPRLYALQSVYPFELTPLLVIPGTLHEEATILFRFRNYKTKPGTGEWFRAVPSLLDFIAWLAGCPASGPWRMTNLLGRPNQLDHDVRLEAARTVTR